MQEKNLIIFFKQQVGLILERSTREPDGFRSYFAEREPRDEEVLGLLSISSMMSGEFRRGDNFPTPTEALAALSDAGRAEICRHFRRQLKSLVTAA